MGSSSTFTKPSRSLFKLNTKPKLNGKIIKQSARGFDRGRLGLHILQRESPMKTEELNESSPGLG